MVTPNTMPTTAANTIGTATTNVTTNTTSATSTPKGANSLMLEESMRRARRSDEMVNDQNCTCGVARASCSGSKYSFSLKPNMFAMIEDGTVWVFVLNFCTESL